VRFGGARDLRATLLSAAVTILAAAPLKFVFQTWSWLFGVLVVVVAMTATALALRAVRAPQLSGTLGMIGVFVLSLTLLFARDHAWFGVLPSPDTLVRFSTLLREAGVAARSTGVPVGDDVSLHFLAALGVGGMLLAIDIAVVVAGWTLIAGIPMVAVHTVVVGSDHVVAEVVSFVCAALAFLWLLAADNTDRVRRYGRRYTAEGVDADPRAGSPLAAVARRMAAAGVAVAVIVPIGVPSLGDGLVGRFDLGRSQRNGTGTGQVGSGKVNLFSFLAGTLRQSGEYPMVDVTTTDPDPHYLRFGVADDVTPDGFVSRAPAERRPLGELASAQPTIPAGITGQRYVAEIDVRAFAERMLPIYLQPAEMAGARGPWGWDDETTVVHSARTSAAGAKYRLTYTRYDYTAAALRTAPELAANDPLRQRFTKLPPVQQVRNRATELVGGKGNQYDRVRAIFDFFSPANGFRYDRFTRAGNSGNAMVDFITTGRVGYCEQYAAALAWLVRAAGIPARVAFGFTRGSQRTGNTFTLSNLNLHAWAEVYFQGFGWVPFDATPPAAVQGTAYPQWAPAASASPGGRATAQPATPIDTRPEPSAGSPASGAPPVAGGPAGGAGSGTGAVWNWPLSLTVALLVVLVLLCLPGLHRSLLRRRRRPHATLAGLRRPRRAAHAAWDELLDLLADYRVPADTAGPTHSCRAIGERLVRSGQLTPAATAGVLTLSRAEERATYARFPLTDADLATALSQVRSGLRERSSRRIRLMATLVPPSVLARWHATLLR
jgi:transglutaminase-like putative cysteine protease